MSRPQVHSQGARVTMPNGYVSVKAYGHPNATISGWVLEHVLIASKVLGKPIPLGVEIHHVNKVRANNENINLVVCENAEYHRLIELRERALVSCGNPNWRRCLYCKKWDNPDKLKSFVRRGKNNKRDERWYHGDCHNGYCRCKSPNERKKFLEGVSGI